MIRPTAKGIRPVRVKIPIHGSPVPLAMDPQVDSSNEELARELAKVARRRRMLLRMLLRYYR